MFPEFHGFFADDFGKSASAVLRRWGSAEALAKARVDSVEKAIRSGGGRRFTRADAERLKELARSSVGQPSAPLSFQLRQLLDQIEFTRSQMKELDAELEKLVGDSPITTVPGVGIVCAAGILGEIGDVSRFEDASKMLAFAGCDPSVFESGEFVGAQARMSKRGSPFLRWYLWLAADRARMYDPALRAYYEKKRAEGKCHKVAVSAVVRKLCNIIFAVLRDDRPYACPVN